MFLYYKIYAQGLGFKKMIIPLYAILM